MKDVTEIDKMVAEAEKELARLEARRSSVLETIKKLKEEKDRVSRFSPKPLHHDENAPVSRQSSESEKIYLFECFLKVERMYIPEDLKVAGQARPDISRPAAMNG